MTIDNVRARQSDAELVQDVIAVVMQRHPQAAQMHIESSDQARYGYLLTDITLTDGTKVPNGEASDTAEEVWDALSSLSWGFWGDKNSDTYLTISLPDGQWLKPDGGALVRGGG